MDRHRGKMMREKVAIHKLRREASERTNAADTLISHRQPPELGEKKFLVFKPASWRCFLTAALQNQHTGLGAGGGVTAL